jgi:hypothetical protein
MARDQRQQERTRHETGVHVVDIESGVEFPAETIDVSRGGLCFHASMEPALGAEMEISFGGRSDSKSLFKVLRIDARTQGYRVAGVLKA